MNQLLAAENPLGTYLKDRRTKLDPAAFGLSAARRRTPGLRREEVAQRANISATWYALAGTGAGRRRRRPMCSTIGIAPALMLTDREREHLFLLGGSAARGAVSEERGSRPRLQRVLDALDPSPALIRTATWDVIAWDSRAASAVLMDYGSLPPEERNMLRFIFLDPRARAAHND